MKFWFVSVLIFLSYGFAHSKTKSITARGRASSYCNANSGSYCTNDITRNSEREASQNIRRSCEWSYRGRSLTHTLYSNTRCNPSYLPPNHDGTWVTCETDARMQCEVND